MEDPESEWEIQEYSSSKEGDEVTMMKWILNKGYGIGKKMVITGIAVSAAPLVLPPLVVFTVLGVAFSVPFGLVFASYACTNKLMSVLLPTPPSPIMHEYYSDEYEQEIYEGVECKFELDDIGSDYRQMDVFEKGYYIRQYEDDDELGRENVMQEEEEERTGATDQEVEVLVTNVDGEVDEKGYYTDEEEKEREDDEFRLNNVVEEEDGERIEGIRQGVDIVFEIDNGGNDYRQEGETSITDVDESVDEESYYTNENEHEKEMEDRVVQREVVIEEEEREQMEDMKQGVEMRLGLDMAGDERTQTEEGSVTNFGGGVDDQGYEEDVGEYLEGDDDILEEEQKGEEPLIGVNKSNKWEVSEDEKEKMVKRSPGLLEQIRDEGRVHNTVENDYFLGESASNVVFDEVKDVETTEPVTVKEIDSQKLVKDGSEKDETVGEIRHVVVLAGGNEENNFNSREVEDLDLVAREVMGDTYKEAKNTESDEKVMRESMGTQEKTGGDTSNDGIVEAVLRKQEEHLIHSNADAREIGDESGLDLFDERNTNVDFENLEAGDEVEENVADENVDVLALPAFKQAPLDTDNAKVASKTNAKMPSREDVLDDERIWERIEAMRTIVGYKGPGQPTCIGELKALYMFTGIELPASFKGDSDLDEVNAKLKFLMSIVGVK